MQIFGQYIINQYILQNTVEIIHKENFFDEKGKTGEKKTIVNVRPKMTI